MTSACPAEFSVYIGQDTSHLKAMVVKKPRRTSRGCDRASELQPTPSDSPVVSDDDGIDVGYDSASGSEKKPSNPGDRSTVEHLPPLDSDGSESGSSSDGDENPVGDIPLRWYDGYDHIGYTQDGEKIIPQNKPSALDLAADPHAWRKVYDEKNDRVIELSHEELRMVARMRAGRYPTRDTAESTGIDEVVAWSGPVEESAITSGPEPKRRFLPSRHEARQVVALVRAMREGKIKRPSERALENDSDIYHYDIWKDHEPKTRDDMSKSERARDIMRVPAPKPPLPTHAESYNPPEEYLPSANEAKKWRKLPPEERGSKFLPTKYTTLRHVPNYDDFIRERFERCLDLYLAVRIKRDHAKLEADDLVPDLPNPDELHPFPTDVVATHTLPARARSIDIHPGGTWLVAAGDDGRVRLIEASTGFIAVTWDVSALVDEIDGIRPPVNAVAWCPNEHAYVFIAAVGKAVVVISAASRLGLNVDETANVMRNVARDDDETAVNGDDKGDGAAKERARESGIIWEERFIKDEDPDTGVTNGEEGKSNDDEGGSAIVIVRHPRLVRTVCWHRKGDYFAVVCRDGNSGTVAVHRLTRRASQVPFKKAALVQTVRFHPTRPFFIVATTHRVRVYNLAVQAIVKSLRPGVSWISSVDVHPSGDHILVSSYDRRVCWFDLDLSVRPYKTLRNHEKAVRVAKYHPRLPLFADASDDGSCHVFHATVYDDLAKNALVVPVTRINSCSRVVDALGVLDVAWHPRLPWLFTAGADNTLRLMTDCWQGQK